MTRPADGRMQRPAPTDHPILDVLADRWSPRAFADRPVERERLLQLLEAARWAPSSYNEQPWRYVLALREDGEEFERMLSCLVEANRKWAHAAPVLMISFARTTFEKNDKPNRVAVHDVGLASANLTTQAMALGLYVHQMAGIDVDRIREVYNVPDEFIPVAGIAVGYAGNPDDLPEDLRQREFGERVRKGLGEIIFHGRWGEAADAVTRG